MPFGEKTDHQTGTKIDFDSVFLNGIRPAADGLDVVLSRSDEERGGGIIHVPMFERLLLAEVAIVDVTLQNANVFYELGVRHAARPRSTIILRAKGTQLPFDIRMLSAVSYRLVDGKLQGDAADELRSEIAVLLREAMQHSAASDSPLFQLIPSFPGIRLDSGDLRVFRERQAAFDLLRERLSVARAIDRHDAAAKSLSIRAIQAIESELGPITERTAESYIEVALTYRDIEAFSEAIDLIERFPASLMDQMTTLQQQYALVLNRRNGPHDRTKALSIATSIVARNGDDSETCGIIGRIYKDQYEAAKIAGRKEQANGFLESAIAWYRRGFNADPRDYYPGVNLATLLTIANTRESLRELKKLTPVLSFALARLGGIETNDYWQVATALELAVLSRDWQYASRALRKILSLEKARFYLNSTSGNIRILRDGTDLDKDKIDFLLAEMAVPQSA